MSEVVDVIKPRALVPDARYSIRPDLREKLALANDGKLYVNKSHAKDHDVLGEIEKIRRHLRQYDASPEIEFATLTKIQEIFNGDVNEDLHGYKGKPRIGQSSNLQANVVEVLKQAVKLGSSDVHLIVDPDQTNVEFRIHGELSVEQQMSTEVGNAMVSAIYMTMIESADPTFNDQKRQQGRLKKTFAEEAGLYSARLATAPTDRGIALVFRLLYQRKGARPSTSDLGYLPEQVDVLDDLKRRGKGIVILSGGTGSGKSTTLECVLSELIEETKGTKRVYTIEHPPEYPIPGAVQTPINGDRQNEAGLNREWASAIEDTLRMDPDYVMIGEVRNPASASAAFAAGMTGHGVFTTLHTESWLGIVDRLRDMQILPSLLTNPRLMRGLINQSLARTLCPHCKVSFAEKADQLIPADRSRIEKYCAVEKVFFSGAGCRHCRRGVVGRTVIAEVVAPTRRLMEIYIKDGDLAAYDHWIDELKGISKCQHLIIRINEGLVDPLLGEDDVCFLDTDDLLKR